MDQETRNCQNCKENFQIEPEDFDFYEKMQVPPPTFCPECRLQRRLAYRNERGLYKRICDLCKKHIISMYPASVPHPVYCKECWISDRWDPFSYGRDYDPSTPFFQQVKELLDTVPQMALQVTNSENSDYANQCVNIKNCYLLTSGSNSEEVYYSYRVLNSKLVIDSFLINRCELINNSIECTDCSNVVYSENCSDSFNVSFCFDIRGSHDCFMSSNLRAAQYVFRNKQLSKDEYRSAISDINTSSFLSLNGYLAEFEALKKESIRPWANIKNSTNCVGQTIANSNACRFSFNIANCENSSYLLAVNNTTDSMDINNSCCIADRIYETCTAGVEAANIKFCVDAWPNITDASYSIFCRNSSNIFGCACLNGGEYCILNKRYDKDSYNALVPQIQAQMNVLPYRDKIGNSYSYGEFFPIEISPFPYSDSMAQDFYPITKDAALRQGYGWSDIEDKHYQISLRQLPDDIAESDDTITSEIIECMDGGSSNERCTKAFRIIREEFELYKKAGIALPRYCPNCRNHRRFKTRNPINLWERTCGCKTKESHLHPSGYCENLILTSYPPGDKSKIYCESCYNSEIN